MAGLQSEAQRLKIGKTAGQQLKASRTTLWRRAQRVARNTFSRKNGPHMAGLNLED
jgi:hypothetical protein